MTYVLDVGLLRIIRKMNASKTFRDRVEIPFNLKTLSWGMILIWQDAVFWFRLLSVGLSVVALCGYYLLFAFHLLDIVTRFDILQSVVKSVTKNFAALSLTMVLGTIILYMFSIFIFIFFNNDYVTEINDQPVYVCTTLSSCFLTVTNFGYVPPTWYSVCDSMLTDFGDGSAPPPPFKKERTLA